MRIVVQRVESASVESEGAEIASIGSGILALVGIGADDTPTDARVAAESLTQLRIFEDADGRMNHDILQAGGSLLIVSNFTVMADCRKGRRPSLSAAAPGPAAKPIYDELLMLLRQKPVAVQAGNFGADMRVILVNDGPVTLLIDTRRLF